MYYQNNSCKQINLQNWHPKFTFKYDIQERDDQHLCLKVTSKSDVQKWHTKVTSKTLKTVFWRFQVRFSEWFKSIDYSGSCSRTDLNFLVDPGPVLELTPIIWQFTESGPFRFFLTDPVIGSHVDLNIFRKFPSHPKYSSWKTWNTQKLWITKLKEHFKVFWLAFA